jgi:hypothetical protein
MRPVANHVNPVAAAQTIEAPHTRVFVPLVDRQTKLAQPHYGASVAGEPAPR